MAQNHYLCSRILRAVRGVASTTGSPYAELQSCNISMDTKNSFFTATTCKSQLSKVARVMNELNLDRVVYFVVRGGSERQRMQLSINLSQMIICQLPLISKGALRKKNAAPHRTRDSVRRMLICQAFADTSDFNLIRVYRTYLEEVFGDKCRLSVRVVRRL